MLEKFYLVRAHTNIRATARDKEPVIVEGEDRAREVADTYEDIVRPKVGDLVPIRVDEYHRRYDDPVSVRSILEEVRSDA